MDIQFEIMDSDPDFAVFRLSPGGHPFAVVSVKSLQKTWAHEKPDVITIIEQWFEDGKPIDLMIDVTPEMRQSWLDGMEEYPDRHLI